MWLDRLKEMKKNSGMTTSEISQQSGIPEPTLEKLFAGATKEPKLETMKQLVHFLGYSLDDLYKENSKILRVDFGAKKAPSQRDEADEIADVFRQLDEHGKGAVRAILNFEHASAVAEQRQAGAKKQKAKAKRRSDGMVEVETFDQVAAAGLGNYLDNPTSHMEQYPANVVPEGTEFGVRISGNSMAPNIQDGATAFVQSKIAIEPGQVGIFLLNGESFCKKLEVDREKQEIRLVSFNPDYKDRIVEECDDFRTIGLVLGHWPK